MHGTVDGMAKRPFGAMWAFVLLLLAACGDGVEDEGENGGGVAWEPCHGSHECADLDVPVDYDAPDEGSLTLRMLRAPASDPAMRQGTVLVSFGGPGVSGIATAVEMLLPVLPVLFPELAQRFDLVVVDPRGVGESTPAIDCVDADDLDALRSLHRTSGDDAEWTQLSQAWESYVDGCLSRTGTQVLSSVTSTNVARDMDRVRAALDEETLNYIGLSYGTYVGALYAMLFPDRVRAFILDSNASPVRPDAVTAAITNSEAYEQALSTFIEDCGADEDCPFHGGEGTGAVSDALQALLDDLEASPLGLADGRHLSTFDARFGMSALARDGAVSDLASSLAAVEAGDGEGLMGRADAFLGRRGDGTYDGFFEALIAKRAADLACPPDYDLDTLRADMEAVMATAPFLGPSSLATSHPCLHWPDVGAGSPDVSPTDAPPLLLLNASVDATTPYADAEAMRDALGNGSHLVRWEGSGHLVLTQSACARGVAEAFLIDPGSPPGSTSCED